MKYIIILLISALSMTGCVSRMFSIGHENFVCNGDTAGGKCMSTQTVYDQKEQIASSKNYEKGEKDDVHEANGLNGVPVQPINNDSVDPNYVFESPKILKVRVSKYRNTNGDLIDDTYMYIRVGKGYWKDEAGNVIGSVE